MQVQKQTRSIDTMKEPLAEPVVKKKPESDKNKSVKLEGRETSSEEEKLADAYTTRRGDKVNGLLLELQRNKTLSSTGGQKNHFSI